MALNPRISKIELGIEELQSYTIYPLSMAGEFQLSDIISKAALEVSKVSESGGGDVEIIKTSIEVIKNNIFKIVEMVTKEDNRPNLNEIDNVQFSELAELIFEMNFSGAIKNFQSLVKRVKVLFPSTGQSQLSSETPVTD
jgi:hypothetical protein